jgi:transcriptional regulator with XRE-family HTH domain
MTKKSKRNFMGEKKFGPHPAFGQRLRVLIRARYRTQTAFADALGAYDADVSAYVRGSVPDWSRLVKMSQLLGVSVDYLLVGPTPGDRRLGELPADLQSVVTRMERLSPEGQATMRACLEVLLEAEPEDMQLVIDFLRHVQKLIALTRYLWPRQGA